MAGGIPGAALALTAAESAGIMFLQSLGARQPRGFFFGNSSLIAQVVVEEQHVDRLRITDHPIERAAAGELGVISDHAYKLPAELTVRCGWSNSPNLLSTNLIDIPGNIAAGIEATANAFGGPSSLIRDIYNQILAVQNGAQLVTILTGTRTYTNMLLEGLTTVTDHNTSDNALMLIVTAREIQIVDTQVAAIAPSALATPQKNQSVSDTGQLRLTQAPLFTPPQ